jgi:hypothetical protein
MQKMNETFLQGKMAFARLQVRESRWGAAADCALRIRREVFSGIDKLITFEFVLLIVKLTAVGCKQIFVCAPLNDLASFRTKDGKAKDVCQPDVLHRWWCLKQ